MKSFEINHMSDYQYLMDVMSSTFHLLFYLNYNDDDDCDDDNDNDDDNDKIL